MSIDLSKIQYGALAAHTGNAGVHVSKVTFGVLSKHAPDDGIAISGLRLGILVGPIPPTRRRPMIHSF